MVARREYKLGETMGSLPPKEPLYASLNVYINLHILQLLFLLLLLAVLLHLLLLLFY